MIKKKSLDYFSQTVSREWMFKDTEESEEARRKKIYIALGNT